MRAKANSPCNWTFKKIDDSRRVRSLLTEHWVTSLFKYWREYPFDVAVFLRGEKRRVVGDWVLACSADLKVKVCGSVFVSQSKYWHTRGVVIVGPKSNFNKFKKNLGVEIFLGLHQLPAILKRSVWNNGNVAPPILKTGRLTCSFEIVSWKYMVLRTISTS